MADDVQKTSFRQFEFCSLCKINHKLRKKHIYSKHHQLILNNILKKFALKINTLKKELFSPVANSLDFEKNAKFWCYFCVSEFNKHGALEDCIIIGSGLLHHIASDDHKLKMERFFYDNLISKELKPKYVLSKEDLHIFQRASLLALKKWQRANRIERQKITDSIVESEIRRQTTLQSEQSQSESVPSTSRLAELPGNRVRDTGDTGVETDRVLSRYNALGLTRIARSEAEDKEGNVHTGAMPPWLTSTDSSASKEIGPTMGDFQKHLERERKAKLPSGRVGAKFDRDTTTSSDWLPSFGRVWSKGRRLQSKLHFEKELRGKNLLNPKKEGGFKNRLHSNISGSTEQSSPLSRPYRNKSSANKLTNGVQSIQSSETTTYNKHSEQLRSSKSYQGHNSQSFSNAYLDQTTRPDSGGIAIVPYKRHSQSPNPDQARGRVAVVPYKRLRKQDHCEDNIQLLQTPLLSQHR